MPKKRNPADSRHSLNRLVSQLLENVYNWQNKVNVWENPFEKDSTWTHDKSRGAYLVLGKIGNRLRSILRAG